MTTVADPVAPVRKNATWFALLMLSLTIASCAAMFAVFLLTGLTISILFLPLIVLLFVFLNYRKQAKLQQIDTTRVSLSTAREATLQIGQLAASFGGLPLAGG